MSLLSPGNELHRETGLNMLLEIIFIKWRRNHSGICLSGQEESQWKMLPGATSALPGTARV